MVQSQTDLDRVDFMRFRDEFVPIAYLAAECCVSPEMVKNRLMEQRVEPADFFKSVGAVLYRKIAVPHLDELDLLLKRAQGSSVPKLSERYSRPPARRIKKH